MLVVRQVTVPGGMVGDVSTPMPAAEVAAMHVGMDAAYSAAVASGVDNGAVIVDPRDGQARLLELAMQQPSPTFTASLNGSELVLHTVFRNSCLCCCKCSPYAVSLTLRTKVIT